MATAHSIGYAFERNVSIYLKQFFPGANIIVPSSQEKSKKVTSGDVDCLTPSCILSEFHIECENRKDLTYIPKLIKATHDAKGFKKPIYVGKRRLGAGNAEKPFAMMWLDDLTKILVELQGYRDQDEKNNQS